MSDRLVTARAGTVNRDLHGKLPPAALRQADGQTPRLRRRAHWQRQHRSTTGHWQARIRRLQPLNLKIMPPCESRRRVAFESTSQSLSGQ